MAKAKKLESLFLQIIRMTLLVAIAFTPIAAALLIIEPLPLQDNRPLYVFVTSMGSLGFAALLWFAFIPELRPSRPW